MSIEFDIIVLYCVIK